MADRYDERDDDRADEREQMRSVRRDESDYQRGRAERSTYGYGISRNTTRDYDEDLNRDYGRRRPPRAFDYERESSYGNDYRSDYGNEYPRRPGRDYERESDYDRSYGRGYGYDRADEGGASRYGRTARHPADERDDQRNYERDRERGPRGYEYESGDWRLRRSGGRGERDEERRPRREHPAEPGKERNWWDRVSDEVASWFGDEEAERRRLRDEARNRINHRGRGPRGYRRSDERIREDINDRLTDHPYIDASDLDVEVNAGEVTLTGAVESRQAKRLAEDIAETVSGVTNVENRLRVSRSAFDETGRSATTATADLTTTTDATLVREPNAGAASSAAATSNTGSSKPPAG
ncbi:MAG TPA: BON domain-containing protein [Pyrinomonadaceae bacterium]